MNAGSMAIDAIHQKAVMAPGDRGHDEQGCT